MIDSLLVGVVVEMRGGGQERMTDSRRESPGEAILAATVRYSQKPALSARTGNPLCPYQAQREARFGLGRTPRVAPTAPK